MVGRLNLGQSNCTATEMEWRMPTAGDDAERSDEEEWRID